MANYTEEIVGQTEFYDRLNLTPYVTIDSNTDGYIPGTIFEFKKKIDSVDEVLFQAIKYLSHMRIKGKPVHKNIILVSLNPEIAYCFDSDDFLSEIEKNYIGGSSKDNRAFSTAVKPTTIRYGNGPTEMNELLTQINFENPQYTRINIDQFCVVGWANRFYEDNPTASKIKMFEELRKPTIFKQFIHAWKGKENDFKYIMDCLNDLKHRRELGAFYTPPLYAQNAVELVRKAIKKIPENKTCKDPDCEFRFDGEKTHRHYVIIDRCAGTGNLQEPLTDEELSHTIVATYELKEWVVLNTLIGDKVKIIIPPTPDHQNGLLNGGDALEVEVFSPAKPYVDNKEVTVIMYENPPFDEAGGRAFFDQSSKENEWKNSLVCKNMKQEVKGATTNELANLFIWSAFKYYLSGKYDAYILFSPIKYWKTAHLVDREFFGGFYCNRGRFTKGNKTTISVLSWGVKDENHEQLPEMPAYDISDDQISQETTIVEKKVHNPLSKIYDKTSSPKDEPGLVCKTDGYEVLAKDYRTKFSLTPLENDNIIGYLATHGFSPNSQGRVLTRVGMANGHGFFLRITNYLNKLPLFAAACFPENKWFRKDVYSKTSDGGLDFEKDADFLKSCLIFTCLSPINKCISFDGSNGKTYLNELCFDDGTLASKVLKNMELTSQEKSLIADWEVMLEIAKEADEYNSKFKYGIYQINKEINIKVDQIDKRTGQPVIDPKTKKVRQSPKYPILNGKFSPLKKKLDEYYDQVIEPKLFDYELLK